MLNKEIARRFHAPAFVFTGNDVARDSYLVFEAGSAAQGALVTLFVQHHESRLQQVRFRAYGSPTLIAFADAFCEALEGAPVSILDDFQLVSIQQQLEVPNTEIHVVMLFGEILQNLHQKYTTAAIADHKASHSTP
ncbi:MAG TPA: iron-sulfur cluster assembly scaffold protein [Paenalcaligenes sp.]|nr:iron-sulfur cluster assembly scaffold protein [Paenalcaligenes sp.]